MTQSDEPPQAAWTRRPRPAGSAVWRVVPLDSAFASLALALRAALALMVLLVAGRVALNLWGIAAAGDGDALDGEAWVDQYEALDRPLTATTLVVLLVTACLWLVWQYRLARSARPGELTRSPGWQVASWMIPVAVLWWPYQNVRDLWWRRSGGWGAATVGWWWSAIVAVLLIEVMVGAAQDNVDSVEDFRDLLILEATSALAALVAGLLALKIQGRLSSAAAPTGPDAG